MVSSVHLLEFETLHNYGRENDRIEVPVKLRSGEESVSFPPKSILGRRGWIDHFRLGLIEYESKLYLNRSDE